VQRSLEGCDRWAEGRGILYFEASVVQWKDIRPWLPKYGPEGKHFVSGQFFYFGGCSEAAMGGGGAQRSVWRVNESKKTGARSARARTRGQNPLVVKYTCILQYCTCAFLNNKLTQKHLHESHWVTTTLYGWTLIILM
jgi:hypothetical protein